VGENENKTYYKRLLKILSLLLKEKRTFEFKFPGVLEAKEGILIKIIHLKDNWKCC
jgi:hypothetical protein